MATEPAAAPRPVDPDARRLEWVKAVGMPAVTLLVTLVGGYYFNDQIKERENRDSNERAYAQLLTQREQSDAQIRQAMLNLVISRFFADSRQADLPGQVLQLELLASNFNQSLDLAPLFKEIARRLSVTREVSPEAAAGLKRRLEVSAASLSLKQVTSLGRRGFARGVQVPLAGWKQRFGQPFLDERINHAQPVRTRMGEPPASQATMWFRVEILEVSLDRREVRVRLRVELPGDPSQNVDRDFWVSPYDFPMLDNTQLPYGLRCSVVITDFFVPQDAGAELEDNSVVNFHLVVFPSESASFKERQDYDDVLSGMLAAGGGQAPVRTASPVVVPASAAEGDRK